MQLLLVNNWFNIFNLPYFEFEINGYRILTCECSRNVSCAMQLTSNLRYPILLFFSMKTSDDYDFH